MQNHIQDFSKSTSPIYKKDNTPYTSMILKCKTYLTLKISLIHHKTKKAQ